MTDIEVAWPVSTATSSTPSNMKPARARIAFSKPPGGDGARWQFRIVPVYEHPAVGDLSHVDLSLEELLSHIIATSVDVPAGVGQLVLRRLCIDLAAAELTIVSANEAKIAAEELAASARAVALAPPPLPAVPAAVAASTEEASPAAGATAAAANQILVAESACERQTKKARKSSEVASTASAAARPAAAPRVLPFTPRSSLPRACADEALAKICALNTQKASSPTSVTGPTANSNHSATPAARDGAKAPSKKRDASSKADDIAAGQRDRAPRACKVGP